MTGKAQRAFKEQAGHGVSAAGIILWVVLAALSRTSAASDELYTDAEVDFGSHLNGATGDLQFVEMTGAGVALLDYDSDGDLDVLLLDGTPLSAAPAGELAPQQGASHGARLYQNQLKEGGKLDFVEVTQAAGLTARAYGFGIATGDFDNDGHIDFYLANFGQNQLWRNRGDGRFEDVTEKAGVGDTRWGSAATFFDLDRDGLLDLYLANYVEYDPAENKPCYAPSSRRDYCGPQSFPAQGNRLWRNLGNGRFEDITGKAGMAGLALPSLGVAALDGDGDGWMDIYVANDGTANEFWRNLGNGRFEEGALLAGLALNADGRAEAGMGIAVGDYDGDARPDLFLSHLDGESNTLYANLGDGLFEDRSAAAGLAAPSLPFTGFGTAFVDVDHDGWLDLVVVNGAVRRQDMLLAEGDAIALGQRKQLFRNNGNGSFEDWSARAGAAFHRLEVSRGLALGDVDNDGDQDLLIGNNGGSFRLLLRKGKPDVWIGLRLLTAGRDALGTEVILTRPDGGRLHRRVASDGSYGAASDTRLAVALADPGKPATLVVRWPDGSREVFPPVDEGRYSTLTQGQGKTP